MWLLSKPSLYHTASSNHPIHRTIKMSSSNSDKEAHRSSTHPRIVCGAVPIDYHTKQILLISSRKHKGNWVLPKGGYELSDVRLETAASREAFEEGV